MEQLFKYVREFTNQLAPSHLCLLWLLAAVGVGWILVRVVRIPRLLKELTDQEPAEKKPELEIPAKDTLKDERLQTGDEIYTALKTAVEKRKDSKHIRVGVIGRHDVGSNYLVIYAIWETVPSKPASDHPIVSIKVNLLKDDHIVVTYSGEREQPYSPDKLGVELLKELVTEHVNSFTPKRRTLFAC